MPDRQLILRELNRTTLARQMLLERHDISVPSAVERLIGLQAQNAMAPYVGLWTRLNEFERDHLAGCIERREVVKATLMRATLHLCTAADYRQFRNTFQPMLTEAWNSILRERKADFDLDHLLREARILLAETPRTFEEISAWAQELNPGFDVGAMRYAIRTHIPLVQVPVDTRWSYPGKPAFAPAEAWIGKDLSMEDQLDDLVKRYLAAFGPASITDIQTWCGLGGTKEVVARLKQDLVTYRDEGRRELYDLASLPVIEGDAPAPVRFLPEYDNLLLSYSKRTRVVDDRFKKKVFLPGLRVAATVLVDGFVRGAWKVEVKKKVARLLVEMFDEVTDEQRNAIRGEAERLVRFVEPEATTCEVSIEP